MSKINRIGISDFRVYQDKQVFDFVHNGVLSNLVVIYAPNGYGKTSFFDAVEWAYSGKIKRFEKDSLRDEISGNNFAKGDQILLTNRRSFLLNKRGVIEIWAADGKALRREVVTRKVSKQFKKSDYKNNLLTGDYSQKTLGRISSTNILTQDQIDSFLRYTSPEERFKALSEFWPEGKEATLTYKHLNNYIRAVDNDIAANHNRSGEIRKAVKVILNTSQHVNRVNESIVWLLANSVLGFKLEPIASPVDDAVYESLSEAAASYVKNGERLRESHEHQRSRIHFLSSQHHEYITAYKNVTKSKIDLQKLEALEKLFTDLQAVTKILIDRNIALHAKNKEVNDYMELTGLMGNYLYIRKSISEQEANVRELLVQDTKDLEKLTVHRQFLSALIQSRDELLAQINQLERSISTFIDKYAQFLYWIREKEQDQAELKKSESDVEEKNKLLSLLLERRRYLVNLAQVANYNDFAEAERLPLQQTLQDRQSTITALNDLNAQLEQLQTDFKHSGSLDENLDRIISWGEEYVTALDADHCPLCKTEFNSVRDLLAQIRSEKVAVLKVRQQQQGIDNLTSRIESLTEQLKTLNETINTYLAAQLFANNRQIELQQAEIEQFNSTRMDLLRSVRYAGDQAQDLYNDIEVYFPKGKSVTDQRPDDIKAGLTIELKRLQAKATRFDKIIASKAQLIEGLENGIASRKNQVLSLQNAVASLQADQRYLDARRLFSQLQITSDEDVASSLERLRGEVQSLQKALKRLLAWQAELESDIARNPLNWRYEQIAGKKLELEQLIRSHNDLISQFEEVYFNFTDAKTVSLEVIQDGQEALRKQTTALNAEIKRLHEFTNEIELISENIKKAALEKELETISAKLPKLGSAKKQLGEARDMTQRYINSQVDSYFNKDVINQIYSRIEPHPELNYVDFIPQISHNVPSLNVRTSGFDDDLNPILFLSAGQLNVLSLSIFLAKGFESGSNVLSTIFMDDPVQNLSDINILSFLDLIRSMVTTYDKQLVISTHDEHFYKLIQHKLPAADFNASYIELADFGRIKQ